MHDTERSEVFPSILKRYGQHQVFQVTTNLGKSAWCAIRSLTSKTKLPVRKISSNKSESSSDGCPSKHKKIKLSVDRCMVSESKCIVYNDSDNRVRIKPRVTLQVYVETGMFIPLKARCCASHLNDDGFLQQTAVHAIEAICDSTYMDAKTISDLLNDLHEEARKERLNFDYLSAISDQDYRRLTGLSKNQFNSATQHLSGAVSSMKVCSVHTFLALLLLKLRTGLSNTILSTLSVREKRKVGRAIAAARSLMNSVYIHSFVFLNRIIYLFIILSN